MKLRKCEFCGTEFDAALGQCPLCGKAVQPGAAEPQPVMPAAYKPAGDTAENSAKRRAVALRRARKNRRKKPSPRKTRTKSRSG